MDLSTHLDEIVKNIVSDIQSKVGQQIAATVKSELENQLANYDIADTINTIAAAKLNEKIGKLNFDTASVNKRISNAADTIINTINSQSSSEISARITREISGVDFNQRMTEAVATVLGNRISDINFPQNSIAPSSIKLDDMIISGNLSLIHI
jgi:hypothetical protein